MPYKELDKKRAYDKEWQQKKRDKKKAEGQK